jgi:hypothetical protein
LLCPINRWMPLLRPVAPKIPHRSTMTTSLAT